MEDQSLYQRLERLEAQVSLLADQVAALAGAPRSETTEPDPAAAPDATAAPAPKQARRRIHLGRPADGEDAASARRVPWAEWSSEDWLQKVGIGLLLFGVVFTFKYTIDQGWLTPAVRVAFGAVLGLFLFVTGLRLRAPRRRLGQVLIGGGVATFYITLFAAYQLYALLPYTVAFALMGGVTLVALGLSFHQRDALLAVIGTVGGLGTPFLLYRGDGSIPGLVWYTSLLLTAAGALYLVRGWRSLVWTAAVGGWLVYMVAWWESPFGAPMVDRLALQGGVLLIWVLFSLLPALRHHLRQRQPERWPVPPLSRLGARAPLVAEPAFLLTLIAPLVTFAFTYDFWQRSDMWWGTIGVGAAAFYAALAMLLYRRDDQPLALMCLLAAAVLAAVGLGFLLEGSLLLVALVGEVAGLYVAAHRLNDTLLRRVAHTGALLLGWWLLWRLLDGRPGTPRVFNGQALSDLLALAAAFAVIRLGTPSRLKVLGLLVVHAMLLAWFYREFAGLDSGQAYISIAWGLYSVVLLVLGFRKDQDLLRQTALTTIGLVVAKLFLVDLANVQAIWRILLFLGFGGVLLLLSYFLPTLWRGPDEDAPPQPTPPEPTPPGEATG